MSCRSRCRKIDVMRKLFPPTRLRNLSRLLSVLSVLAMLSMPCTAAARSGATSLPAPVAADLPGARLAGEGSFRWMGIKIYDATLWVGDSGLDPAAPYAHRFALDLAYARDLEGSKIAQASSEQIEKLGEGSAEQREAWTRRMEQLFPDVSDGTHITGVYLPGRGAHFYRDGKRLGDIADRDFARAFFAIWLDPRTSAPDLRAALLRHAAKRPAAVAVDDPTNPATAR
jgi:hypothetical protein